MKTKTTDELREEEIEQLTGVSVEAEEVGLEDLIILGEEKKIPIHIVYPKGDGSKAKAKALVRQLTLEELDLIQVNRRGLGDMNRNLLRIAFFKSTGEPFSDKELNKLPLGVVNAVTEKILELSGVNVDQKQNIMDF